MNYTKSVEFRGNLSTAFTVAVATLGAAGFVVASRTDRALEMTGPGGLPSSRQSLLCSISRIRFAAVGSRLEMEVETGGKRWARIVLPALIAFTVSIGVAVQILARSHPAHGPKSGDLVAVLTPLVTIVVVALVAVPLAIRTQRRRLHQTLDALLDNMVAMGREF
jgi:hypothetical protein